MTKMMINTITLIAGFVVWVLLSRFLHPALSWLFSANLIGFSIYGFDKWSSERPVGMRVPNQTLYFLAILGGVFGSLAGVYLFKHKTLNIHFKLYLWFIASLYIVIPFVSIALKR